MAHVWALHVILFWEFCRSLHGNWPLWLSWMLVAQNSFTVWDSLKSGWCSPSFLVFFFSSPRYNKWKTSTIKVTWTSVLKPKCTFNLSVILGSEVWRQIVRRNQFPPFTCSTQEIQKTSVLWYDSHLVKKGAKSMPVSVAFIEKQKHLCLLILLLLLKI